MSTEHELAIVEPQAAAAVPPKLRGRLERFEKRTIIGWAFDPENIDRRVAVEIVVDDKVVATVVADGFRGDLDRLKIGDGAHGFSVALPRDLFDGTVKSVVGRDAESGVQLLSKMTEMMFDAALGAPVVGKVVGVTKGELVGYVFDPADGSVRFDIVGRRGSSERSFGPADLQNSAGAEAAEEPEGCGFALALSPDDFGAFVSGDLKIYATPGDIALEPTPAFLSGLARLDIGNGEQDVAVANIVLSPGLNSRTAFDIFVDDKLISNISWDPSFRQRTLPVYLERTAGAANRLSVRFADTAIDIAQSPQSLWKGIRRDAVSNGRFQEWDGAQPAGWTVQVPAGVSSTKLFEPLRALRKGLIGNHGIRLEAVAGVGALVGATLSQTFYPGEVLAGSVVNVIVGGRAEQAVDLSVALSVRTRPRLDGDQEDEHAFETVSQALRFERAAALRSLAIQVPQADLIGETKLTITVTASAGDRLDLMLVAMGAPGFEVAASDAIEETGSSGEEGANAVLNGDFKSWLTPFVSNVTNRRQELAENWAVASRQPCPAVQCRLASLSTRDVRSASSGSHSYGLSLLGPIAGTYLRIEGLIDPFDLVGAKTLELSFYARTADEASDPSARPNQIREVYAISRSTKTSSGIEEAFHDQMIAKFAKDIRVTRTGRYYRFQVSERDVTALRERARAALYDPSQSILIAFHWTEHVDCTLTDITLGSKTDAFMTTASGVVAIEDPNISAQLGLLKGLDGWASNTLTPPAPLLPQARKPQPWSWPEKPRSLDIVIPVYNAVEDTLECLASLERHTKAPHRVVVVDDASEGDVAEQIDRFAASRPWIEVIRNSQNQGYTKSANLGMAASNSDWVLLLNSDTIVTPGWLEGLFEAADARPDAAMIGPLSNAASWQSVPDLYDAKGKWRINPIPEGVTVDAIARAVTALSDRSFPSAPLLNGFCTLIKRAALDEVGYLDEIAFPVGYGEENDLCIRVGKAGHALVIADHIYVYHKKSASFGLSRRDALSKAGTQSFMAKHPDVDLRELQLRFTEMPALTALRLKLRDRLGLAASRDLEVTAK